MESRSERMVSRVAGRIKEQIVDGFRTSLLPGLPERFGLAVAVRTDQATQLRYCALVALVPRVAIIDAQAVGEQALA